MSEGGLPARGAKWHPASGDAYPDVDPHLAPRSLLYTQTSLYAALIESRSPRVRDGACPACPGVQASRLPGACFGGLTMPCDRVHDDAPVTAFPRTSAFRAPILQALTRRGGEASNVEIEGAVARELGLSDEQQAIAHDASRGNRTELAYRLAWARTRLKNEGLIEPCGRKRWVLTAAGRESANKQMATG